MIKQHCIGSGRECDSSRTIVVAIVSLLLFINDCLSCICISRIGYGSTYVCMLYCSIMLLLLFHMYCIVCILLSSVCVVLFLQYSYKSSADLRIVQLQVVWNDNYLIDDIHKTTGELTLTVFFSGTPFLSFIHLYLFQ